MAQTHNWAHFDYANLTINTSFSGLTVYGPANGTVIPVLTRVITNDRARFAFVYNSWGQVNAIWQYGANDNQRNASVWNYNLGTLNDCPRFGSRQDWASDWLGTTGNPNAWVYTVFQFDQSDAGGTYGKATNPEGTEQKEYFVTSGWQKGLNTRTETRAGGVLRRWTTTQWTQDNTLVSYPLNPRPTETNVYDEAGNRRRTTISYRTITLPSGTSCSLPQDVTEFKADAVTPLRTTHTDYQENANYLTRRIIGLPTFQKLYEGSTTGALYAMTGYIYDEGGEFLQTITGTVTQFDATAGGVYRGNVTTVRRYDVIQSGQKDQKIGYNNTGAVVFTRDPLGHQTELSYTDSFSDGIVRNTYAYPTKVTDPDGRVASPQFFSTTQYNYDFGAVTHTTNPKGAGVTYTWDLADTGRLFSVQNDVNSGYVRYVYDNSHNYLSVYTTIKDANTEYFSFQVFDGYGRQRGEVSDHPGSVGGLKSTFRVFDWMGRIVQASNPTEVNGWWAPAGDDAAGYVWSQQAYDWKGRPTITTNQDGTTRTVSYDSCGCAGGEKITLYDEGQYNKVGTELLLQRRKLEIFHDVQGRVSKTQAFNWDGSVYATTTNTWNVRDQVSSVKQYQGASAPDGSCLTGTCQEAWTSYDGYGRISQQKRPVESGASLWVYNLDDTPYSLTDARGATTTWSYNNRHLVTGINYSVPVGTAETGSVSFDYDAAGNRTWMIEGATSSYGGGRVDYTWDTLSQLQAETRWFNDLNRGYTISYGYNVAGQLTSLASPFSHTVNFARDRNGRPTDVSDTAAGVTTSYTSQIRYRAWDGLKSLTYGNGLTQTRTHNPRQQLTSFLLTGRNAQYGAADVMKTEYQYHPDGQPKFAEDKLGARFTRGWEYDYAGRLAVARTGSEAASWLAGADPTGTPTGPYKQTYTYNAWQEVTSREARFWSKTDNDTAVFTNARRQDWNYDNAGNVVGDGNSTYTFDANGRNTWIEGSNLVRVTQQHDGDGQVVKQVTSEPNGPKPWHRTSFKTYYLRATGLGGQTLARLDQSGNPGSEDFAVGGTDEVRRYNDGSLRWIHQQPLTGSRGESQSSTNYLGTEEPDSAGVDVGFSEPVEFPSDYDLDVPTYTGEPTYDPTAPQCYLNGIPTECGQALRLVSQGMASVDPARTDRWGAGRLGLQQNWQLAEKVSFYTRTLRTDEYNPDGTLYGRAGEERMVLATDSHWEFTGYALFGIGAISGEPVFGGSLNASPIKRPWSRRNRGDRFPQGNKQECDDLKKEIDDLVEELQKRASDLEDDFRDLVPNGYIPKSNPHPIYGSVEGHQEQFRQKQRSLRDKINYYDDRCRHWPIPSGGPVEQFATRRTPNRIRPINRVPVPIVVNPASRPNPLPVVRPSFSIMLLIFINPCLVDRRFCGGRRGEGGVY